jgi:predicted nuclease with TOPRIM domain
MVSVEMRALSERVTQLEAENARLREALEKIADTDPDDGTHWFHVTANAALASKEDAERQRAERNAHVKAQIERIHSYMPDAEERN